MPPIEFMGRKAVRVENDRLRVTAMVEGGHVAEILHKSTGVNPLWTPHWKTIEPSSYSSQKNPEFGDGAEARLVAGMLGHILCLDLFGEPSAEEARAGIPVHGEAAVARYDALSGGDTITLSVNLPLAQMRFERTIRLTDGSVIRFSEEVHNQSATDRPIAWTQHVTLGAPFLECGLTQISVPATRSKVSEVAFNNDLDMQKTGADFEWPLCPRKDGGTEDLRVFATEAVWGGFTTHLMDPAQEDAYFAVWSPRLKLLFGYAWRRAEFPWLARWEENHIRTWEPWNEQGLALGMEFGVSPLLESRRAMVERGRLFGTPTYRWVPAQSTVRADYCAFITEAKSLPKSVRWVGADAVEVL